MPSAGLQRLLRRVDPRYERRFPVELVLDGHELVAQSRNVSLGGVYLLSPCLVPEQTTVRLRFRIPTNTDPIEVAGEVRWVDRPAEDGSTGVGIRFQGLRARDVWALNRFFNQ